MNRNLASVIAKIQSGSPPSLMLFFGDELQVQEACRAILDRLVPEDARAFNLERFDGHTASWDQIEASMMTPPFFPGRKVLWVENAPYFFSREQKGELGAKVLQLWNEGNADEASKLLADWLVVEGWTQEQWEGLDSASLGALPDMLTGADQELKEAAEGVLIYGRSRGLRLLDRREGEGHGLHGLLDRGFPPWSFLLMTAIQVDRRTRLYKRLEEIGAALNMELQRDRAGKISREALVEFIDQRLRQAGKSLEPRAREMILVRAGHELRGFGQELEKLLLYVGDRPTITARDVEAIVADQGEAWIFDLTRSVADRNVAASLGQLGRLLAQGEHPLKLLGTLAGEVRKLIAARQLIDTELSGIWRRGMNYEQFQKSVLKQGGPLLTRNPYADYMCFQRADHFCLDELILYMRRIFEADLRLKSSGSDPRLLMERLILEMCLSTRSVSRANFVLRL
ncbi:MAG TPA: DNA polymerase III subunit delta [Candidatus Binatia bacterium]|nr:DNA polymerase III subunit delta [Candidatus Binatia bacterium]